MNNKYDIEQQNLEYNNDDLENKYLDEQNNFLDENELKENGSYYLEPKKITVKRLILNK